MKNAIFRHPEMVELEKDGLDSLRYIWIKEVKSNYRDILFLDSVTVVDEQHPYVYKITAGEHSKCYFYLESALNDLMVLQTYPKHLLLLVSLSKLI